MTNNNSYMYIDMKIPYYCSKKLYMCSCYAITAINNIQGLLQKGQLIISIYNDIMGLPKWRIALNKI